MSYAELLLTPEWRGKREIILRRDGYKCTVCGSKKKLTVHHTYYKDGKKPWQYPCKSLLTLCDKCHHEFHCAHEIEIKSKSKHKRHKIKREKVRIRKFKPIESKVPRYRKKVNNEWVLIELKEAI